MAAVWFVSVKPGMRRRVESRNEESRPFAGNILLSLLRKTCLEIGKNEQKGEFSKWYHPKSCFWGSLKITNFCMRVSLGMYLEGFNGFIAPVFLHFSNILTEF